LVNKNTNRKLELDGYCDELKLGFEAHGIQHYKFVNFYHRTMEQFDLRQKLDQFKIDKCAEYGIEIIVIPYMLKKNAIVEYITEELHKINIVVLDVVINYSDIYHQNSNKIDAVKTYANTHGGQCLSDVYINNKTKMTWLCDKCNREWELSYDSMIKRTKRGKWCLLC